MGGRRSKGAQHEISRFELGHALKIDENAESVLTVVLVLILVPGLAVVFRLAEQRDRPDSGGQ